MLFRLYFQFLSKNTGDFQSLAMTAVRWSLCGLEEPHTLQTACILRNQPWETTVGPKLKCKRLQDQGGVEAALVCAGTEMLLYRKKKQAKKVTQ